jgi:hypothetical protein
VMRVHARADLDTHAGQTLHGHMLPCERHEDRALPCLCTA